MAPRPPRSQWRAPKVRANAASKRGAAAVLGALQALYAPERTAEQLLAERERLRVEAERQRCMQGALLLRGGD